MVFRLNSTYFVVLHVWVPFVLLCDSFDVVFLEETAFYLLLLLLFQLFVSVENFECLYYQFECNFLLFDLRMNWVQKVVEVVYCCLFVPQMLSRGVVKENCQMTKREEQLQYWRDDEYVLVVSVEIRLPGKKNQTHLHSVECDEMKIMRWVWDLVTYIEFDIRIAIPTILWVQFPSSTVECIVPLPNIRFVGGWYEVRRRCSDLRRQWRIIKRMLRPVRGRNWGRNQIYFMSFSILFRVWRLFYRWIKETK